MANTPQFETVTEAELQGFVDVRLAPERHMEIDSYLARMPQVRTRVDAYREINQSLQGLYGSPPLAEAGAPLRLVEQRLGEALIRRRKYRWGLAVAAAMVISVGIGMTTSLLTRSDRMESNAVAQFTGMAAKAHHLYAENEDGLVRIGTLEDQGVVLFEAMSQFLPGLPERAPDLSDHGYRLVGGQMNPGSYQPSLHFVYQNDNGKLISLHAGYADNKSAVSPVFTNIGTTPAFYWRRGGVAFTLVGHVPQMKLLAMAQTISRGEQTAPAPGQPVIKKATTPVLETAPPVPAIEKTVAPAVNTTPVPNVAPPAPEAEAAAGQEPKDT